MSIIGAIGGRGRGSERSRRDCRRWRWGLGGQGWMWRRRGIEGRSISPYDNISSLRPYHRSQPNYNYNSIFMDQAEIETIKLEKQQKLLEEQRKFRNLQSDRKYYAEQAVTLIKKQKGTIQKLKKENETLKQLIAKLNDRKAQQTGTTLPGNTEQRIQQIKQLIQEQKQVQAQTKGHISNFQKKIIQKKNHMGGYNAGAQNQSTLQKQIKILQNRLDKANQKFNQAIAINRQLRQVIDSLRRQRVIFDNLYRKLQRQLHEKRKQMANIIQKANTAYQERDKANSQIQNLKQQAKKQTSDFEKELKELSALMEKAKLANCIRPEERPREEVMEEPDRLFARTTKNLKHIREKVNVTQIEKIQKYREDFGKIQAATQIQDFHELIRIFNENQEKNFKIFKYVNQQSNQIEQLQAQVHSLRTELSHYQLPTTTTTTISSQPSKQKQVQDLQHRLLTAQQKHTQYQQKHKLSLKQVKVFLNQIQTIFNTIECDKDVAKEVAGSRTVSQGNMMLFLGIIEEKVIKIVKAYKEIAYRNSEQVGMEVGGQGKKQGGGGTTTGGEAFAFDDLDDDQEEYEKLLSHEDFRRKANEKIMREQNSKNKKRELRMKKK